MDITITPKLLSGAVSVIPSKSQAHRLLICAAFADSVTSLHCQEVNRDIETTVACLNALGAKIMQTDTGYVIHPVKSIPQTAEMNCHDSGSTLRFLLPVVGALGIDTTLIMEGRLPQRPLSPLWEEMERMGCRLSRPAPNLIRCQGKLRPGIYNIPGNISSQYITGLLFAGALIPGSSRICISGTLESKPYVTMTQKALDLFGVDTTNYRINGGHLLISPGIVNVEGDWSNGAFFLAANALGSKISIENLSDDSPQGDRAAAVLIPSLSKNCTISAVDIPDLVPILSIVAACNQGAIFTDIQRLRLKESDRVETTIAMIESLGGKAEATSDTLTVHGTGLTGGTVDSCNDHRIAMSAAIAATVCTAPVKILGAECVGKSYPRYFDIYRSLGGSYEQHLW